MKKSSSRGSEVSAMWTILQW